MKSIRFLFALIVLSPVVPGASLFAKEEVMTVGSVRPKGKVKAVDLPALAKISFEQALKAALGGAPGAVIKAELEIEDGNLVYSFEIVGSDKSITEVEIDAGTGKVLGKDKEKAD